MRRPWCHALIFVSMIYAQIAFGAQAKSPKQNTPECAAGAICFSGEVSDGHGFRKAINDDLEFSLGEPDWTIQIVPRLPEKGCVEFAAVVNEPYRAHNSLQFDSGYGVTAEEEVAWSPREFNFVTNCDDYRTENDRLQKVLWPYSYPKEEADKALAELGTSPLGKGRLWITASQVSHTSDTPDDKLGKIEWMRFSVEILLPKTQAAGAKTQVKRP